MHVPAGDGGPAPSIVLSSTDICSTEPHTASVENVFASYDWSVTNAAFRVTTPVPIYAPSTACAGTLYKASAPYWFNGFAWTATNATIEGPSDGESIFFRATGSGSVVLSVHALDSNGCFASNSVTISVGAPAVPEIWTSSYETICPIGYSSAQVDDFYPSYDWTITNAINVTGLGTSAIQFDHAPDTGDVVVSVTMGEGACAVTATRTFPVRSTIEPLVEGPTSVCANGTGTFYIDNYASFSSLATYITNGTITGSSPRERTDDVLRRRLGHAHCARRFLVRLVEWRDVAVDRGERGWFVFRRGHQCKRLCEGQQCGDRQHLPAARCHDHALRSAVVL